MRRKKVELRIEDCGLRIVGANLVFAQCSCRVGSAHQRGGQASRLSGKITFSPFSKGLLFSPFIKGGYRGITERRGKNENKTKNSKFIRHILLPMLFSLPLPQQLHAAAVAGQAVMVVRRVVALNPPRPPP